MGRLQNAGKQSAYKNNSIYAEGITLNGEMKRKYSD
jgi:hypothetical protein